MLFLSAIFSGGLIVWLQPFRNIRSIKSQTVKKVRQSFSLTYNVRKLSYFTWNENNNAVKCVQRQKNWCTSYLWREFACLIIIFNAFFQTDRVLQWDWIRKRAIALTPAKKGHGKGHPFRNILIAAWVEIILILLRVCSCLSEGAVQHFTSAKMEEQQIAITTSTDRGQQRNRYTFTIYVFFFFSLHWFLLICDLLIW